MTFIVSSKQTNGSAISQTSVDHHEQKTSEKQLLEVQKTSHATQMFFAVLGASLFIAALVSGVIMHNVSNIIVAKALKITCIATSASGLLAIFTSGVDAFNNKPRLS